MSLWAQVFQPGGVQGSIWLVVCGCFVADAAGFARAMWWCAVAGLWFLPVGTLLSIVQLLLLHRGASSF